MLEGQEITGDAAFVAVQTMPSQSAPTTQTTQTTHQPGQQSHQQQGNHKRRPLEEFFTSAAADVSRTKGPGTVDEASTSQQTTRHHRS